MKNPFLVPFCLFALLVFIPTAAQAEPPFHLTTVSWVVATRNNLDVDDRYVTLIGHVTRRIGDETYWFTDGTGSVRLDSENFDLPIGPKIVIGGRIDQAYLGFGHLEVDVRHWHYAKNP
ncbi:MAG: NirD/YgiW/YdeI family stress tolerance protein [Methylacidiphilales bacterium]|nr:NirD/YgiW/YdeI family stress tolerance protein [Candidatus Methylacidiphilales bacterium]